MKLFLSLFFMSTLFITAQTTHDLDWSTSSGTALDLTIEPGDTVRWTWTDSLPHDVASTAGVDPFNSGAAQTGVGETFSRVFNIIGATDYICNIHPATMGGTITVVDNTASVEDLKEVSFNYAPNPAKDFLTINAESTILKVEVYSIIGQKVLDVNFEENAVNLDISSLEQSTYYAKIFFENNSSSSFTILKK